MFQDLLQEPREWARRQFGDLDLGDKRRNERAVKIAELMVAGPGASFPRQMGERHQAKAAYRFFDTPDHVTFESLASGHWKRTREEISAMKRVLLIGDTTEIDYTHHPDVTGLEFIGNGRGKGMNLHSVLAIDPDKNGQLVGLAWQDLSYRQKADKTQPGQQPQVWAKSVAACGRAPAGEKFVHLCDAGSDDFSFFTACFDHGGDFLSRIYRPRKALLGHQAISGDNGKTSVLDLARSLDPLGGKVLSLRSRKRQKKKIKFPGKRRASTVMRDTPAREVKLLVSAAPVSVFPPGSGEFDAQPLQLWVVRVWEPNPPPEIEPIEWILLTSLPVTNLADALLMAQWYSFRWLIEEYHKCLKTGCRVEKRQLETSDRLEAMLGINVVIAARLLAIKQQTGESPDTPAIEVVDTLTVKVLIARQKLQMPADQLTVYKFWRQVAQLGGFLGRKNDGEPGWQTLWLGWQELQILTEGARLLSAEPFDK